MPSQLQRLFVKSKLHAGAEIALEPEQAHYLRNVLRLNQGDAILLFNGADGEWCATLTEAGKKKVQARASHQTRTQEEGTDLHYLFAPLKRARLDYMAQKATEMGASVLRPVITRRTVAERVKTERLIANAIEAAEQCGILRVPEVWEPEPLGKVLDGWDAARLLITVRSASRARPRSARFADRPRGRLRARGTRRPLGQALRRSYLAWAKGDACRHRCRRRACLGQRGTRRLALMSLPGAQAERHKDALLPPGFMLRGPLSELLDVDKGGRAG